VLFAFAHNQFFATQIVTPNIQIGVMLFDQKGDLTKHFNSKSEKTAYLNYKKDLWDSQLRSNSEQGIVVNFQKLPSEVSGVVFYLVV